MKQQHLTKVSLNQPNSFEIVSTLLCATREDNSYTYNFCITVLNFQYWFHY